MGGFWICKRVISSNHHLWSPKHISENPFIDNKSPHPHPPLKKKIKPGLLSKPMCLKESRLLIFKWPMWVKGAMTSTTWYFENRKLSSLRLNISLEGNTDFILVKMTFSIFPSPGFWYNNFLILTFHILPFEKFKSESSPCRRRGKPELRRDFARPFLPLALATNQTLP